ncbi:hypothetical protein [Mesorhizobium sp.]|uniref:hypothetical protein n=1 Tax=Mesorhizobium sp. TaxID=1871066 RepID=UPI00338FCC4B
MHVAVVGDIDAKALRARLDQLFGDLPQKQALAPVPDVTPKRRADAGRNALPQTSLQRLFPPWDATTRNSTRDS